MGATNPNAGGAPGGGGKGGMGRNPGPGGNAQNNPMANFATAMQSFGQMGSGGAPMPSFQFNRPEMQSGNLTPINQAIPTPQPQEPVGGYINGQPAQWHYQAEALKNPPPRTNSVGLPSGGLLARLYGG